MNSEQEQSLVKQAKLGDREALSQLWEAITPKLFGYLVNVTRNHSLAEDLLQSTWLKAIKALPRFEYQSNSKFNAWLFAIARNECKQYWRKSQRETDFLENQALPISNEISNNESSLMVEQILNKLSEDDRELIRLRYIADLSLNDIAAVLNLNFIAVRVRLHRALNRAKTQISINSQRHE